MYICTYVCMYTCMQYTRHESFYVCTRCSHLSSKSALFVFILGAIRCATALRLGWDEDSAAAVAAQDDSPRRSATPPSAKRRAGVPAILLNSGKILNITIVVNKFITIYFACDKTLILRIITLNYFSIIKHISHHTYMYMYSTYYITYMH